MKRAVARAANTENPLNCVNAHTMCSIAEDGSFVNAAADQIEQSGDNDASRIRDSRGRLSDGSLTVRADNSLRSALFHVASAFAFASAWVA